jgi:hypothetical protein
MVRHGVSLRFIDAGPDRLGYYEARLSGQLVAAAPAWRHWFRCCTAL